jgi:hypothetical protein
VRKQLSSLILALLLCLNPLAPVAAGVETLGELRDISISIPEIPGLTLTLTGVYDQYNYIDPSISMSYMTFVHYTFFVQRETATLRFNRPVSLRWLNGDTDWLSGDMTVEAGESVNFSEYPDMQIWVRDDGAFSVDERDPGRIVIQLRDYWARWDFGEDPSVMAGGLRSITGLTASASGYVTAVPLSSEVLVNGEKVRLDAYTIAGNNYFKLRDLAAVLKDSDKQFAVNWDAANNAIAR